MKFKLFTIVFLVGYYASFAQFGTEQLISMEAELPVSIIVADLDGDGFKDVLTGARSSNEVAWFKNVDGYGSFGPIIPIWQSNEVKRVQMADLDGDGDLDIIVCNNLLDTVHWHENLNGAGAFGTRQIVDMSADGVFDAVGADIDGDGDMDIVAAIDFEQSAVWYENLDGAGNFGTENSISFLLPSCRSVFPVDIDNDGDLDVVANSAGSTTISWFENTDGQGTFGPQNIVASGDPTYASDVISRDIDGDGDFDIIGTYNGADTVFWFENLDGAGNFSTEKLVTNEALQCTSIFAADLDNDGDQDVIYGSTPSAIEETSEVAWSENLDGLGNFGPKQVLSDKLMLTREVFAVDVDSDGDQDIFATSQNNNKIVWFENRTILGVDNNVIDTVAVYPNPTQSVLFISSPNIELIQVTITNNQGKTVVETKGKTNEVDVSALSSGVYVVTLSANKNVKIVKQFIKE
ncbi:T9SS type A sorting domain-containing protein [Rasiella rasia]|uniref:T9SS type A sorting domain-containing protein n=1 Tax=Rasiella rasia TaxID=2744027 RepID=A0A6G6GQ94_9FLAO|nr:T9SS type A sorting domain-containing protein [Rasiella rasia]QIE60603.1 T9SS type A sorting domain-containing protein [Rasiella rasia]